MDVDKLLRLKEMVDQAATADRGGRSQDAALVDSWHRIGSEVRVAIEDDGGELVGEFDRLFPEQFKLMSAGVEAESERAAIAHRHLVQLVGWLNGQVKALTLDRVIEAEAAALAAERAKRVGFAPSGE